MSRDVVAKRQVAGAQHADPLVIVESLAALLAAHGLTGSFEVEPIGEGLSNATYLLRFTDGRRLVLRRPPRGPLLPSAHNVLREARILRALERSVIPLPRVLLECEDRAVIGAPFYVMDHVAGHAPVFALPPALEALLERRRFGEALVDVLVSIHDVDLASMGLELGRPSGHLERQVELHLVLWEHSRGRDLPEVERLGEWLRDAMPDPGDVTLVHGDFHPANVLVAEDPPARITAVLDWELATRGDPLADVGYLCALWPEATDAPDYLLERGPITRGEGSLTRRDICERYSARTGRDLGRVGWYEVLALWRAVIFMEGNSRRARLAGSDSAFLNGYSARAPQLLAAALDRAAAHEETR